MDFHTYKTIKTTKTNIKSINLPRTSVHLSMKSNRKSADCALNMLSEITNDEDFQLFLDPDEGYDFLKVFLKTKSLSSSNEMDVVDQIITTLICPILGHLI